MIEDEAFYDACDEFGVMLLQEMPHAGCAPGGPGDQVSGCSRIVMFGHWPAFPEAASVLTS